MHQVWLIAPSAPSITPAALSQVPHYSLSIPSITHSQFPQLRPVHFPSKEHPLKRTIWMCVCVT